MAKISNGTCAYCGKSCSKNNMIRHLKVCEKRRELFDREKSLFARNYYTLMISDNIDKNNWIILDIDSKVRYRDLHQFLSRQWIVNEESDVGAFDIVPFSSGIIVIASDFESYKLSMHKKLDEVLSVGDTIYYLHGFLRPTELKIDIKDMRCGRKRHDTIVLEAQNEFRNENV